MIMDITIYITTTVLLGWLSGAVFCYKINKRYREDIIRMLSLKYSGILLLAIILLIIVAETHIFVFAQQLLVSPWSNKYHPPPNAAWIVCIYGISCSLISIVTGYIIYLFKHAIRGVYGLLIAIIIVILWLVIILPMGYPLLLFIA